MADRISEALIQGQCHAGRRNTRANGHAGGREGSNATVQEVLAQREWGHRGLEGLGRGAVLRLTQWQPPAAPLTVAAYMMTQLWRPARLLFAQSRDSCTLMQSIRAAAQLNNATSCWLPGSRWRSSSQRLARVARRHLQHSRERTA